MLKAHDNKPRFTTRLDGSFNISPKHNLNQPTWDFLAKRQECNLSLGPSPVPHTKLRWPAQSKPFQVSSPKQKMSWPQDNFSFVVNSALAPAFFLEKPSILYNPSEHPFSCQMVYCPIHESLNKANCSFIFTGLNFGPWKILGFNSFPQKQVFR